MSNLATKSEEVIKMKKEQQGKPTMEKTEILKLCICPGCPTYVDCSKQGKTKEKAFCMPYVGKSKCITKEKGCICGACPVKAKLKLKNFYFCIKGSEEQQNKK
jgi:hypothetical protein